MVFYCPGEGFRGFWGYFYCGLGALLLVFGRGLGRVFGDMGDGSPARFYIFISATSAAK